MAIPKRSRRLLRYSLRTMLVVVLVVSVWAAYRANQAHRQRLAVSRIRDLSGQVFYDYERDAKDAQIYIQGPEPPGPQWLRELVGIDWLSEVIVIRLRDVGDEEVALLADLPDLKRLFVRGPKVTDAGLAHLGTLSKLEYLEVEQFQISDDALRALGDLQQLEFLVLRDIDVTDAGLAHLEPLSGLRRLYLERTNVSSTGVEHFKQRDQDIRVDYFQ